MQRIGIARLSQATQILQPIHSRIASNCPDLIFFGKKGSAIEGRAAPIKSTMPRLTSDTIISGEVKRPTADTLTSHKSGSSASISTTARPSSCACMPSDPLTSSTAKRKATAQLSPTSSLVSSINSRISLTRFLRLPPYSSIRSLTSGSKN